MPYAATLDANVLHPQITADLLLRLAERGLFRVIWSEEILAELYVSLVRRDLDERRIRRRIDMMRDAFPEAQVAAARVRCQSAGCRTRPSSPSWRPEDHGWCCRLSLVSARDT